MKYNLIVESWKRFCESDEERRESFEQIMTELEAQAFGGDSLNEEEEIPPEDKPSSPAPGGEKKTPTMADEVVKDLEDAAKAGQTIGQVLAAMAKAQGNVDALKRLDALMNQTIANLTKKTQSPGNRMDEGLLLEAPEGKAWVDLSPHWQEYYNPSIMKIYKTNDKGAVYVRPDGSRIVLKGSQELSSFSDEGKELMSRYEPKPGEVHTRTGEDIPGQKFYNWIFKNSPGGLSQLFRLPNGNYISNSDEWKWHHDQTEPSFAFLYWIPAAILVKAALASALAAGGPVDRATTNWLTGSGPGTAGNQLKVLQKIGTETPANDAIEDLLKYNMRISQGPEAAKDAQKIAAVAADVLDDLAQGTPTLKADATKTLAGLEKLGFKRT